MKYKVSLLSGMMLAGMSCTAVHAESLEEALIAAYTANPTLQAQRAALRVQDELVPQALSNWRPTVRLSGDIGNSNTYSSYRNSSSFPNAYQSQGTHDVTSPRDVGLTVSQPLYRGGRTVAQVKQAEATVMGQRATLANTEETVLLNAATAYLNVLEYQAVLELNRNNVQVLQRQLDATNDRFRVGEVTRTDVAQAESRLAAAQGDVNQSISNLQTAQANYMTLMGHAPDHLVDPGKIGGLPLSAEDGRNLALESNPGIISAQYAYDAATYAVDVAFGQLLPSVTLNGTAQRNFEASGTDTYSRTMQASVNISVPIYQQGQEYSQVRQQKHQAGQRQLELDAARRSAIETVTSSWETLQAARARIASYTEQIRAAEIALEGVRRESQVGSRTVLDVLNAEQELLTARVSLVQAKHDESLAAFQLKSGVGQMTAQALSLPVPYYDPVKHYDEVRDQWIGTGISPDYGEEVR